MGLLDKKHKTENNKTLLNSFKHAYDGVMYAVVRERNMHIHLIISALVLFFGAFFSISYTEWLVCLVLIALVLSLEILNTAIEAVVDLVTTKENEFAKLAKDASAGAVLVSAIISAFIGLVIFMPKIFEFLINL